ncbi:hypothetical protein GFD22_09425 [Bifidobacterium avesanii]|uniref:DUF4245 family protein n=1 Tax=Bifidobacterium avesanii TaxID=1798157 RepID=A0A7K3TKI7_9BIFI|nr:hypothetical protein [Bifidobacterium avesanii]
MAVVVAAAIVVIIALVTAFIAPGWALKKNASDGGAVAQGTETQTTQAAPATPTISPSALPSDATELLKAMPDTVLNFARTGAGATSTWQSAKVKPIEEYTLTYSTGDAADDVTIVTAQWSKADDAKTQYDALASALTGKELASGNIKVSGSSTGSYVTKEDASDSNKAVSVWRNDTVVFQATGSKQAVQDLTKNFPL